MPGREVGKHESTKAAAKVKRVSKEKLGLLPAARVLGPAFTGSDGSMTVLFGQRSSHDLEPTSGNGIAPDTLTQRIHFCSYPMGGLEGGMV